MSKCRSCRAEIRWAGTANGKAMPLDAKPCAEGNITVGTDLICTVYATAGAAREQAPGAARYLSHFATCPTAFEHRRKPIVQ